MPCCSHFDSPQAPLRDIGLDCYKWRCKLAVLAGVALSTLHIRTYKKPFTTNTLASYGPAGVPMGGGRTKMPEEGRAFVRGEGRDT